MSTDTTVKPFPLKDTELFKPIKVGKHELSNRIVFVPSTRLRALPDHTPSDLELQYFKERTQYPGSLVATDATFISEQAGLYDNVPGIWADSHVKGWKKITDAVHENKSFAAIQLWNLGRVGNPELLKKAGLKLLAPSEVYASDEQKVEAEKAGNPIQAYTEEEIHDIIYKQYDLAAKNAVKAGFDYLELHGAHGYAIDQFLHPSSNQRTDKYGGSVENRTRFALELIDHLISIVGADKLAIRLSPWATFQGVKAAEEEVHPVTTISYLVHELQKRADKGNKLAYISIVEPRANGIVDVDPSIYVNQSNTFVGNIWKGVILKAGNYTYDSPEFKTIQRDVKDDRTLIGFSRYYISNPDLVNRLKEGLPLTPYDRDTFYSPANWGFNTYTKHGEKVEDKFNQEEESKKLPKAIEGLSI